MWLKAPLQTSCGPMGRHPDGVWAPSAISLRLLHLVFGLCPPLSSPQSVFLSSRGGGGTIRLWPGHGLPELPETLFENFTVSSLALIPDDISKLLEGMGRQANAKPWATSFKDDGIHRIQSNSQVAFWKVNTHQDLNDPAYYSYCRVSPFPQRMSDSRPTRPDPRAPGISLGKIQAKPGLRGEFRVGSHP